MYLCKGDSAPRGMEHPAARGWKSLNFQPGLVAYPCFSRADTQT